MPEMISPDSHSFANPHVAKVTHLHWDATINVEQRVISATASWHIQKSPSAQYIRLDTKGLLIDQISTNDQNKPHYTIGEADVLLGSFLEIAITDKTHTVAVRYRTAPEAEALQWLTTTDTLGNVSPILFTQSQAILARSWIPCQDSPGVRFTYSADVRSSTPMLILMSASNPVDKNDSGEYHFEMKQPIPSYLLALAAGDLVFESISARSGIYASPAQLEAAVWEFADLEKMITAAEELYGSYAWERYDLLVLPPSFPFGGMENPRLTFVTPTILAGDRSLTSLVAHELAHSWSGNLVTNATWNDFWLNEGFTVYFETRIMEKLYGVEYAHMLMSLNMQDLLSEIESLRDQNLWSDTKLKLDLTGRNPDDGVTEIAYNKGFFFLYAIEEMVGRKTFDQFVKSYFKDNAFQSMDTERFIVYLRNYFSANTGIVPDENFLHAWIFTEGLPSDHPQVSATRFANVDKVITDWQQEKGKIADTQTWSTHEWLHFLNHLPATSPADMHELDAFGHFTSSGNAEIIAAWGVPVIRFRYTPAYDAIENFLIRTGRRKFLVPLYTEMLKTEEGTAWAKKVYRKARPGYHFVATNTFDKLIEID